MPILSAWGGGYLMLTVVLPVPYGNNVSHITSYYTTFNRGIGYLQEASMQRKDWILFGWLVVEGATGCNTQASSPTPVPEPPKNVETRQPPAGSSAKTSSALWADQAALYASIGQAEPRDEAWTTAERSRVDTALAGSSVPKISKLSCHQTLCVIELAEKVGAADLVIPLTQREVFIGQAFYIYGDGDRTIIYASRKGAGLPTGPNNVPPASTAGGAP